MRICECGSEVANEANPGLEACPHVGHTLLDDSAMEVEVAHALRATHFL